MLILPDPSSVPRRHRLPPQSPAPPPPPMDPEVEAQLRRLRATQYGAAVRNSLANWHARQRAKRQEAADAVVVAGANSSGSASSYVQQRAAISPRKATCTMPTAGDRLDTAAAAVMHKRTTPRRPWQAIIPRLMGSAARQSAAPGKPQQPWRRRRHASFPDSTTRHVIAAAADSRDLRLQEKEEKQDEPISSDAQLSQTAAACLFWKRLLEAEGSANGDPLSIVNLYLQDCSTAKAALVAGSQRQPCMIQQQQTAADSSHGGRKDSIATVVSQHTQSRQSGTAAAEMVLIAELRPVSGVSGRENMSNNVVRHQRSSSSILLDRFDAVAEVAPSSGPLHHHAAQGLVHGPQLSPPSPLLALPQSPLSLPQKQQAAEQGLHVVIDESSKREYVQQWLCASSPAEAAGISEREQSVGSASTMDPQPEGSQGSMPQLQGAPSCATCSTSDKPPGQQVAEEQSAASELQLLASMPPSTSTSLATVSAALAASEQLFGLPLRPPAPVPNGSTTQSGTASVTAAQQIEKLHVSPCSQQLLPLSLSELQQQLSYGSSSSSRGTHSSAQGEAGKRSSFEPGHAVTGESVEPIAVLASVGESPPAEDTDNHVLAVSTSASFGDAEISYGGWGDAAALPVQPTLPAAEGSPSIASSDDGPVLEDLAQLAPAASIKLDLGSSVFASATAPQRAPMARPSSPPLQQRTNSPAPTRSCPGSPASPRQRPLSPHATDDKYPTPPRSPSHPPLGRSAEAAVAELAAPAVASPLPAGLPQAAPSPLALQPEYTFVARGRPPADVPTDELLTDSSMPLEPEGGEPVHASSATSPEVSNSTVPSPGVLDDDDAELQMVVAREQPLQEEGHSSSPPRTPTAAVAQPPLPGEGCPGSAVVDDDTVVQTGVQGWWWWWGGWVGWGGVVCVCVGGGGGHPHASRIFFLFQQSSLSPLVPVMSAEDHMREYLEAMMAYFWDQRAEAYLQGEEPLGEAMNGGR